MMSDLDQLFDYLERVEDSIQGIDRVDNTVYMKARNGRIVSLRLTAADASQLATRTDLDLGRATRSKPAYAGLA